MCTNSSECDCITVNYKFNAARRRKQTPRRYVSCLVVRHTKVVGRKMPQGIAWRRIRAHVAASSGQTTLISRCSHKSSLPKKEGGLCWCVCTCLFWAVLCRLYTPKQNANTNSEGSEKLRRAEGGVNGADRSDVRTVDSIFPVFFSFNPSPFNPYCSPLSCTHPSVDTFSES